MRALAQQFLPQVVTVLIRFALALIFLTAFDWRMMITVFIVIPIAVPFAFLSYGKMKNESKDLQQAQQDVSSGILEYVAGIQTLKDFNMAGNHRSCQKGSMS
ncbi:MAG: hypothetical protein IJN64_19190 [Lachnospiraceae bacterium]|nr:hypothetical protein [Lachnospiraceae bacterium]